MKNPKTTVFYDCHDEASTGVSHILNTRGNNDYEVYEVNIREFESMICSNPECSHDCFIVTDDPESYMKYFVSNNIITRNGRTNEKIANEILWKKKDFNVVKKIFFTSDTHFGHKNIIKYCNRPWCTEFDGNGLPLPSDEDVSNMEISMIERWNSVVGQDDIVYHLGDFALGDRNRIPEIRSKLNGKIRIILGNHDFFKIRKKDKFKDVVEFFNKAGFDRVYDKPILIDDFVILSHEPMQFVHEPFFNIFGHVHDTQTYKTISRDSCCVCVERWDYTPVEMDTIRNMQRKLSE